MTVLLIGMTIGGGTIDTTEPAAVVCGTGGRIVLPNSYALTQVDVVVDAGFIGAARPRFFCPPI